MKKTSYRYMENATVREMTAVRERFIKEFKNAALLGMSVEESLACCLELCAAAKETGAPEMRFLPLAPVEDMPSDARVDFVMIPTYTGTAFILNAVLRCPKLLENSEIAAVLPLLMKGCCARNFEGHGYETLGGTLDAMEIFAAAGAGRFVKLYPEYCPGFTRIYNEKLRQLEGLAGDVSGLYFAKEDDRTEFIKRVKAAVSACADSVNYDFEQ